MTSPTDMVVRAKRTVNSNDEIQAVIRVEQDISNRIKGHERGRRVLSEEEVEAVTEVGGQVAVRSGSHWVRARVEAVTEMRTGPMVTAFLTDWGDTVNVDSPARELVPLLKAERTDRVAGLAHRFALFGLQPLQKIIDLSGASCGSGNVLCQDWSPVAVRILSNMVKAAEEIIMKPRQEGLPYPPFYGDLEIHVKSSRIPSDLSRYEIQIEVMI